MYTVYKITDLRSDQIVYIGKTKDYEQRKYYHFTLTKTPVQKYMQSEGRANFEMVIIQDNIETNTTAVSIEDVLIRELKPLMNKNRSGNISADWKEYQRQYQKKYHQSEKWKAYWKDYMKNYQLNKKLFD